MTTLPISQLPLSDYGKHRAAFFNKMPNNSVALFPAAS
jgi:Xaa-Pro aminopeptidase